jgi:hypothetical protein
MLSRLAPRTPKPRFYQLPYAALSTDVLAAGVQKAGSLRASEDRFFQNLTTYIGSEKYGVAKLNRFISQAEAACPKAGFVLAGYSQGAMLIHDYLTQLARQGSGAELRAIRGTVLVADPERTPQSSVVNFGTARSDGYGVCRASENILRVAVCVSSDATQDVPPVYPNMRQVCDDGDIVCDTSVLLHLNTLNGWKAQVKGGLITHETYCVAGRHGSRCSAGLIAAGRALGQRVSTSFARSSTAAARGRSGSPSRRRARGGVPQ